MKHKKTIEQLNIAVEELISNVTSYKKAMLEMESDSDLYLDLLEMAAQKLEGTLAFTKGQRLRITELESENRWMKLELDKVTALRAVLREYGAIPSDKLVDEVATTSSYLAAKEIQIAELRNRPIYVNRVKYGAPI